jgi:hypothetical protein
MNGKGREKFNFITPEKCKRSISYKGILGGHEGNRMIWAPKKIGRN